jgi:hypothetical protein
MLAAGAAWGQSSPDDEYRHAGHLRRNQQLEQALAIYEQLGANPGEVRAQGERGITEAQMGRWVAAEEHLVAALDGDDRWTRSHRAALQGVLEAVRGHLADLTLACNVRGAALRVNGVVSGTLPRTTALRVPLGPVVLDVTADHYDPHRDTLQISERSNRVEVTLVPEAPTVAVPVAAPAVPVVAPVVPVAAPVVPVAAPVVPVAAVPVAAPAPAEASTSSVLPALRITAFTLGAAGIALGIAGNVTSTSAADAYGSARCQEMYVPLSSDCQGYADTFNAMQIMEIAGFVAGGVFTAGGLALLFVDSSRSSARATVWSCGQGPGSFGLSCGTRF